MKRYSVILILAFISFNELSAQVFRGIGIFAGATTSRHRYVNSSSPDSIHSNKFPSPSHKSAEYVSYSFGLMAEFLRYDRLRWQTELEYCNKGAKEFPFLSPLTEDRGPATINAFTYIQWNNYLKYFLNEGYWGTPYFLLGGRIEYNLQSAISIYPSIVGTIPKIKVTPDVALGYEFVSYYKLKPFVELHYNPDLINKKIGNISFNSRTWELRVGVIFRPFKSLDNCNAPKIKGNYF